MYTTFAGTSNVSCVSVIVRTAVPHVPVLVVVESVPVGLVVSESVVSDVVLLLPGTIETDSPPLQPATATPRTVTNAGEIRAIVRIVPPWPPT
jgi:hypothetical protein